MDKPIKYLLLCKVFHKEMWLVQLHCLFSISLLSRITQFAQFEQAGLVGGVPVCAGVLELDEL